MRACSIGPADACRSASRGDTWARRQPLGGAASLRAVPHRNRVVIHTRARPGWVGRIGAAYTVLLLVGALCLVAGGARASNDGLRRLDDAGGFPPIGMHLDHPQSRGHWIFSYRYVRASSSGLADGQDPLSADDLLGTAYPELPTEQVDQAHIMGVAYAPLDRLTFELSLPYRVREQWYDTTTGSGVHEARGIGDARFVFVVPFIVNRDQETHLTAGFTFPTGSVRENGPDGERLPYNVQLGSGTWDVVWGITYTGRHDRIGWGGEVHGVYRIGENSEGYTQGTVYEASGWMDAMAHDWVSLSARVGWSRRTNVRGSDPLLDPTETPSNDPYKQGWNRLEIGPGANVLLPVLGGQRFAIEWLFPIFQTVSGPQLERDWTLTAGFQWLY